jgi:hypothetical protein
VVTGADKRVFSDSGKSFEERTILEGHCALPDTSCARNQNEVSATGIAQRIVPSY